MLPFGSIEFFFIIIMQIVVLLIAKLWLSDKFYKYVLAALNFSFLYFVYPHPFHFFLLIFFSYGLTYLLTDVLKVSNNVWAFGTLLVVLPLLLVKLDISTSGFKWNDVLSFAGLSYASFRILGYYMDKAPDEKITGITSYFNFIAFTPTMLIGPIDRYAHFKASEGKGFSAINYLNFEEGWKVFVKGLAFKFLLAELVDRYWLNIFDYSEKTTLLFLNEMYSYYFYLFFDFAGYSFMALGIGKMMGIEVPMNFTNPFLAVNPQDFWQRFHISLGAWLRDYFFTPVYMFLSRKTKWFKTSVIQQNVALLLTFLLMGCWNGLKFNFIMSGLLFGIYSVVHNSYKHICEKKGRDIVFGKLSPTIVKYMSIAIVFNLVAFSLYVFSGRI